MLWISSIKRIICPSLFWTSFNTAFNRSSNSPRYFAPAISDPISSEKIVLFFRFSGTSFFAIRWAKPSTIAVFPTPGSPIKTGLFLLFRERIRITSRISSSRPMIGSCLPLRACFTKSTPYFSRALYCSSWFLLVTCSPPRKSSIICFNFSFVTPWFSRKSLNGLYCRFINAKINVSTAINSSPSCFFNSSAFCINWKRFWLKVWPYWTLPSIEEIWSISWSSSWLTSFKFNPAFW